MPPPSPPQPPQPPQAPPHPHRPRYPPPNPVQAPQARCRPCPPRAPWRSRPRPPRASPELGGAQLRPGGASEPGRAVPSLSAMAGRRRALRGRAEPSGRGSIVPCPRRLPPRRAAHPPFARQRRPISARRREAAANQREARGGDRPRAGRGEGHVGWRGWRGWEGEGGEAPLGAAILRRGKGRGGRREPLERILKGQRPRARPGGGGSRRYRERCEGPGPVLSTPRAPPGALRRPQSSLGASFPQFPFRVCRYSVPEGGSPVWCCD